MKNSVLIVVLSLFISNLTIGQTCDVADKKAVQRLMSDIEYLASDELEGRHPGTEGERKARIFIAERYSELGLDPMGTDGYFQHFTFEGNVKINTQSLVLNGKEQTPEKDFYAVKHSVSKGKASGSLVYVGYGIAARDLDYNDYDELDSKELEGKIFVMDISSPDGIHPHSKYISYHSLDQRIETAFRKGAAGVILIQSEQPAEKPEDTFKGITGRKIPVVFSEKITADMLSIATIEATIEVDMEEVAVEAHNVIGFMDNGAEKTIVIGAHYDHLGYGGEGSRYTGGPAIHNGADDNASGVAGILELAYLLNGKKAPKYANFLFIAFSAEEKGLLGSKYFTANPTIDLNTVMAMMNYDMIGHMEENAFTVNGVGTSPQWTTNMSDIQCKTVEYTTTESGIGPSDHTSFYLKDIPSIHFFTGAHEHYHKPSDDVEIIVPEGAIKIVNFSYQLIGELADDQMEFTATKQEESMRAPKFSVTLGVMPDYAFSGKGMKIDGIIDDRPAQKAGMEVGDIVIRLGEIPVNDMRGYMTALSSFEKGQKVDAVVLRNGEEIVLTVQF